ncbi:MAG: TIGR03960 family B12-binding radical SAM protein [Candidatus Limivicinus sp.]|nr:TIGR03960 family B12-binding radical SAM protein [Clostridiales bacterium]MDY6133034.1 TIGR03960 family B12-binding radical SAM protein [Candidatus Limivicinus sp.]
MDKRLERILPKVQKPARYTGGEYNQIIKDKEKVGLRLAFCFPDTYEIGMSNLGMSILYHTMNSLDYVWCERVFAPWGDMHEEMKKAGLPLYALESGDSVGEFDAVAFSIGYEMAYTTVLDMLDMSGIPLRSADRPDLLPLVFAGGTACVNPEPMAPFMDLFVIGEGEEMNNELLALLHRAKLEGWSKHDFLTKAAQIGGVYVPSLYEVEYKADGTLASVTAKDGAPERVTKRIVEDFDAAPFPTNPIVPSTEVVHDRVNLELFRGCVRGCRFCQAGHVYRPIRAKKPETLIRQGIETLKNTGHEDVTLLSLSTSDYRPLPELCDGLLDYCEGRSIGLSLPSLRADNFSMEIMERLQKVRKSGLTFAVEGGSQRLRDAINKNVTEEDLLNTCRIAFEGGWNSVKLYYMLGLPTETDEDIVGIAEMANQVLHCWRQYAKNKNRGVKITISTSCFIPKPHSPFQWEAQISIEEYLRRVNLLRSSIVARNVTYNWHDAETSLIEAALSRADRRGADVIEEVWRSGGRLDAWTDYFSFDRWIKAFEKCGVDPAFYANREFSTDELLPWDVIDVGVRKAHLLRERQRCYESTLSPDCRKQCSACGAARLLKEERCDG